MLTAGVITISEDVVLSAGAHPPGGLRKGLTRVRNGRSGAEFPPSCVGDCCMQASEVLLASSIPRAEQARSAMRHLQWCNIRRSNPFQHRALGGLCTTLHDPWSKLLVSTLHGHHIESLSNGYQAVYTEIRPWHI